MKPSGPDVSVLVASYNSRAYIQIAIESALRQEGVSLEVVVVDDASTDDSLAFVRGLAEGEPRIKVVALERNAGPAGARNRGIAAASGEWLAILDSDDLYHPQRLRRLIDEARAVEADIIADDILFFDDADRSKTYGFLQGARAREASWLDLETYLRGARMMVPGPNYGYLKPVFRLDRLRGSGVVYDETLRIAEDDDLLCRLLLKGLRLRLHPLFGYFYRRHSASISYRLTTAPLDAMIAREERFRLEAKDASEAVRSAIRARQAALSDTAVFNAALLDLKRRNLGAAAAGLLRRPSALALFRYPATARLARLADALSPRRTLKAASRSGVCLLSRQRLIGRTNGSSTYLLSIVEYLRRNGVATDLVQPSPAAMGRWPIMRLSTDMRCFASIRIRGAIRVGDLVLSTNPALYLAGGRAALATLLRRVGVDLPWIGGRNAPYSIAAPFEKRDLLYTARHMPASARRILLDYAFQAELLPFCLRPEARPGVVMHDLFSARPGQFVALDAADSVSAVDPETETRLLARCGTVFAIQEEEAAWVRSHAPGAAVVLTPMAVEAGPAASPGRDNELLFVGSNTAPNIDGLQWFFDAVWPAVLAAAPSARLSVVGSVSRGLTRWPSNVRVVGVAPSLADYYAEAGVVISPLRAGTGLKIKLIEALAAGKAVVATSVTLQGVVDIVGGAVRTADEAKAFAEAVLGILNDAEARRTLAEAALVVAREQFGEDKSYGGVLAWARSDAAG